MVQLAVIAEPQTLAACRSKSHSRLGIIPVSDDLPSIRRCKAIFLIRADSVTFFTQSSHLLHLSSSRLYLLRRKSGAMSYRTQTTFYGVLLQVRHGSVRCVPIDKLSSWGGLQR
jgi:hypothetical protein